MLAVLLEARRAFFTVRLEARFILGANTDTVADFDALLDLLANANGFAYNLMAHAASYWKMLT